MDNCHTSLKSTALPLLFWAVIASFLFSFVFYAVITPSWPFTWRMMLFTASSLAMAILSFYKKSLKIIFPVLCIFLYSYSAFMLRDASGVSILPFLLYTVIYILSGIFVASVVFKITNIYTCLCISFACGGLVINSIALFILFFINVPYGTVLTFITITPLAFWGIRLLVKNNNIKYEFPQNTHVYLAILFLIITVSTLFAAPSFPILHPGIFYGKFVLPSLTTGFLHTERAFGHYGSLVTPLVLGQIFPGYIKIATQFTSIAAIISLYTVLVFFLSSFSRNNVFTIGTILIFLFIGCNELHVIREFIFTISGERTLTYFYSWPQDFMLRSLLIPTYQEYAYMNSIEYLQCTIFGLITSIIAFQKNNFLLVFTTFFLFSCIGLLTLIHIYMFFFLALLLYCFYIKKFVLIKLYAKEYSLKEYILLAGAGLMALSFFFIFTSRIPMLEISQALAFKKPNIALFPGAPGNPLELKIVHLFLCEIALLLFMLIVGKKFISFADSAKALFRRSLIISAFCCAAIPLFLYMENTPSGEWNTNRFFLPLYTTAIIYAGIAFHKYFIHKGRFRYILLAGVCGGIFNGVFVAFYYYMRLIKW